MLKSLLSSESAESPLLILAGVLCGGGGGSCNARNESKLSSAPKPTELSPKIKNIITFVVLFESLDK